MNRFSRWWRGVGVDRFDLAGLEMENFFLEGQAVVAADVSATQTQVILGLLDALAELQVLGDPSVDAVIRDARFEAAGLMSDLLVRSNVSVEELRRFRDDNM